MSTPTESELLTARAIRALRIVCRSGCSPQVSSRLARMTAQLNASLAHARSVEGDE